MRTVYRQLLLHMYSCTCSCTSLMVTDSILMRVSKACTADFLTPTLSWVVRRRTIATTTLSLEPVRVREFNK